MKPRRVLYQQIPQGRHKQRQKQDDHPHDLQIRPHQRGKVIVVDLLGEPENGAGKQHHRRGVVDHQHHVPLHDGRRGYVGPLGIPGLGEGVPPLGRGDGLGDALLAHGDGIDLHMQELLPQLPQELRVGLILQIAQGHVGVGPAPHLQPL